MAFFKSGNPALRENTFKQFNTASESGSVMTIDGTVNKTAFLLCLVLASASYTWSLFNSTFNLEVVYPYLLGGTVGGFIVALIIIFKNELSPYLAPVYAILEGLALGGLSALFNKAYPGVVLQALLMTVAICAVLLALYRFKVIQVTQNFRLMVVAATGGIALYYLLSMILHYFGIEVPLIHESSPMGIIFSLVVVAVASMNLVLDFDFIEQGATQGAPKYMEWYGAFGVMVTLIWLYLELLRLLGKLSKR